MSQSVFDFDLVVLGFASSSRICRLRVDSADCPSLLRRGAGSEVKRDGWCSFWFPVASNMTPPIFVAIVDSCALVYHSFSTLAHLNGGSTGAILV